MIKSLSTPRGVVVIRQATTADASQFRELRLEALLDSPTSFSTDYEKTASYPNKYWEDLLTASDNEATIFIAEHEGHIIAMAGIMRGRSPKTKHAADVWGVYVNSAWRGLRIAQELIGSSIQWAKARDVVLVRLAVVAINDSAIRCYERCGFKIYGTEPRGIFYEGMYYDEYVMLMDLDSGRTPK